ncbi:LysR family transcriptional regulator [Neopusillimonas aromaticivorans]|uniref:LysR family transcriptional regulator n=1 Tax=Neopusillimonas aromaticivorans TaxID=2979868 RepID=UPI0025942FAB|nr:LysR family transcriptional regulator [Neopusillimonas aromaticivorans]WJJ92572.1 LysR family transcriptional regulator [Neopusillimonas aromaticivorans]
MRQLEHMAGVRLFYRSARGVRLTESGEAVLRRSKLALDELRQAAEDLAATQGKVRGRLVIGSLPLSSGALVPRAVDRVLARHKDIQIAIVDGTYDGLMYQLRHADIDVLVGALRPHAPGADIIQTPCLKIPCRWWCARATRWKASPGWFARSGVGIVDRSIGGQSGP